MKTPALPRGRMWPAPEIEGDRQTTSPPPISPQQSAPICPHCGRDPRDPARCPPCERCRAEARA
jgi:hypothetical protein